jgi:uncharacterized protein DUF998
MTHGVGEGHMIPAATGRLRLLAACGIAAPLVFTAAVLATSRVHPGYDQARTFISELGATGAPAAGVMNLAGFLAYGLLVAAFALAVHHGMRPSPGGRLGPALLAVYGVAYVAVALAPCEPGCQAAAPPTLHHRMHLLIGDLIVLTAVLGPFALYARMVADPAWRSLAPATLLLPGLAWVAIEASGIGLAGAVRQRLWLLLLFTWLVLMAVRLLRIVSLSTPMAFRE